MGLITKGNAVMSRKARALQSGLGSGGRHGCWSRSESEKGQGLVEAAVAFLFLLSILLAMFEMAVLFSSYIALLNTSIQGAIYAAGQPLMQADPPDAHYDQYVSIIRSEALAGGLSWTDLGILPPQLPANVQPGSPITVTVRYTLTTFASEIAFPFFERFGLPSQYHINARAAVPIR